MPKPCSSNGGLGCVRGFVREKCYKCILGSIACDMCHTGSSMHNVQLIKRRSRTEGCHLPVSQTSKLSSSATSTNDLASERPPPSRTASISIQLPPPSSRHRQLLHRPSQSASESPRGVSLNVTTSFAKRTSISAPSSPTTTTRSLLPIHPTIQSSSTSRSCIFCVNGRKACAECFGLGYVQRICQECIRDQHRRNSRKTSLPTSLNLFGTKIKEQFSESTLPHPFGNFSTTDILSPFPRNSGKGKKAQKAPYIQPRSKSMVTLPTMASFESPVFPPFSRSLNEVIEDVGEGSVNCNVNSNHDRSVSSNNINNTNISESIDNSESINNTKKKSLKAMVMSTFKFPILSKQ